MVALSRASGAETVTGFGWKGVGGGPQKAHRPPQRLLWEAPLVEGDGRAGGGGGVVLPPSKESGEDNKRSRLRKMLEHHPLHTPPDHRLAFSVAPLSHLVHFYFLLVHGY